MGAACPTSRGTSPRSSRGRRSTSGRSPPPSTSRCSGRRGSGSSGEGIMQRRATRRSASRSCPGVTAPALDAPFFKEFVVRFDGTGKTVADVNRALSERGIFGGKDSRGEFPELGQSALYCVTEIHTKADLDALVDPRGGDRVTPLRPFHRRAGTSRSSSSSATPGERGILCPRSSRRSRSRSETDVSRIPAELRRTRPPALPELCSRRCCGTTCGSRRRRSATTSTSTSAWAPAR